MLLEPPELSWWPRLGDGWRSTGRAACARICFSREGSDRAVAASVASAAASASTWLSTDEVAAVSPGRKSRSADDHGRH